MRYEQSRERSFVLKYERHLRGTLHGRSCGVAESVAERTFEGFEPEVPVEEEIGSLGKSMGLVMDERDVEEHSQERTTVELQELQSQQQHSGVLQGIGFEEEPEVEEVISTREIKEGMWERVRGKETPRKSCNWSCIGAI